jgi:peroxiredoxin family protein
MADEQKKKVSMVVFSGDMDKLIAAFLIATGAAASGFDVTMFFTFWGLKALQKKGVYTGKGFFQRMLGIINGGDISKTNPSRYGFGGIGRWMFKKMMKAKNVPSLTELRQLALDLGVRLYGCQMTMDVMGTTRDKMMEVGVTDCVGVAFFIEQAKDSAFSLFI